MIELKDILDLRMTIQSLQELYDKLETERKAQKRTELLEEAESLLPPEIPDDD